jgi:hypothetical protein
MTKYGLPRIHQEPVYYWSHGNTKKDAENSKQRLMRCPKNYD